MLLCVILDYAITTYVYYKINLGFAKEFIFFFFFADIQIKIIILNG